MLSLIRNDFDPCIRSVNFNVKWHSRQKMSIIIICYVYLNQQTVVFLSREMFL